jgi:hypothetical protein
MALLAWQAPDRKEWYSEIDQAIGGASARGARMFSLADQHTTGGILAAAGFTDVAFTDVREPVCYGADSAQAYDFVTACRPPKTCWPAWIRPPPRTRCAGCASHSPGTRPATACCFGRAAGPSPREHRAGNAVGTQ